MAAELRNAIGTLIKEKGGDLVRDTLVKAGNEETPQSSYKCSFFLLFR